MNVSGIFLECPAILKVWKNCGSFYEVSKSPIAAKKHPNATHQSLRIGQGGRGPTWRASEEEEEDQNCMHQQQGQGRADVPLPPLTNNFLCQGSARSPPPSIGGAQTHDFLRPFVQGLF